jgi:hypothetical protein
VEKIMRYIAFVVALLCLSGCSASRSTPRAQVASVAEKQFYTDAEAQAFLRKLPEVKYPTTIRAVCTQLGIDLSRLGIDISKPVHPQLFGPGSGATQWHTSQLSQSHSIAFLHNINDKSQDEYRIYKIDIWKFKNRD